MMDLFLTMSLAHLSNQALYHLADKAAHGRTYGITAEEIETEGRHRSQMNHKIYLASSWRNPFQPELVELLREWGHEVYDFRNPEPGNTGFNWSDINPGWESWTPAEYRGALNIEMAEDGFNLDMNALAWADITVLLLPCGASAHSEAAWHRGTGRPVIVHITSEPAIEFKPELMYKMFNAITTSKGELQQTLGVHLSQIREMHLSNWRLPTPRTEPIDKIVGDLDE